MDKINKFLLILVIILIFILIGIIVKNRPSYYYAVYLETGELYFGKLSYFPYLHLSSAFLLQRTNKVDTPFSLTKFEDAFWKPQGEIRLNSSKIVWIAKIKENSPVVDLIQGKRTYFSSPEKKEEDKNSSLKNNEPNSK